MPNNITNIVEFTGPNAHEAFMGCINKEGLFDFNEVIVVPKDLDIPASSRIEGLAAALRGEVPVWSKESCPNKLLQSIKEQAGRQYKAELKLAKQRNRNIEKYGFPNWYEANRNVWGTKWNAYSQLLPFDKYPSEQRCRITQHKWGNKEHKTAYAKRVIKKWLKREKVTRIQFDTAWSTPKGVWEALLHKLPEGVKVDLKYADEDLGSNCGHIIFSKEGVEHVDVAAPWTSMSAEDRQKWTKYAFHIRHGQDAKPQDWDMNDQYEYVDDIDMQESAA